MTCLAGSDLLPPRPTTGIDYLALIDATHTGQLAAKVNYAALAPPEPPAAQDAHPRMTNPEVPGASR